MRETPNSKQAFEDYYGLGPERSVRKLAEHYKAESAAGKAVPTKRLRTVGEWSSRFDWPKRVIARVEEDGAEVRKQLQERSIQFRLRLATAIEVDVSRYLSRLALMGSREMMADDAVSVERLGKLFFQLTGQPLAEKIEHAGAVGIRTVPLPVFSEADPLNNLPKEAEDDCPANDEPSA